MLCTQNGNILLRLQFSNCQVNHSNEFLQHPKALSLKTRYCSSSHCIGFCSGTSNQLGMGEMFKRWWRALISDFCSCMVEHNSMSVKGALLPHVTLRSEHSCWRFIMTEAYLVKTLAKVHNFVAENSFHVHRIQLISLLKFNLCTHWSPSSLVPRPPPASFPDLS